ncbi:class I SAM-dependent methyltransferase [Aporhodopirellula aestuarii]|uniref:Class I SAM-dependent methyltransferase n=1 Tax=Aporhodopirellula aestuarii TaxID=2950107 RepID=A0ABT0U4M8_9BACT|nr:class I SAM-dependent methyltransferase [Aporhodopirellula aestuarii]MCM2371515.1 class I SAM-dependent methyltransferase [Aporhodopirellula aestuarii]
MDSTQTVKSKITGGPVKPIFDAKVLGKYCVTYWQCLETMFIQTDEPYWLDEAYSTAITDLDLGLAGRNVNKAEAAERLIDRALPDAKTFLDFGGGYGLFTRLMRDKGFDFRHYDIYCQNIFAKGFELDALEPVGLSKFDLVTAWEVFEHAPNPRELIRQLLSVSGTILFSTELVPEQPLNAESDWWYFTPETGQHVSFYSRKALHSLAEEFNLFLYSDNTANHILSARKLEIDPFPAERSSSSLFRLLAEPVWRRGKRMRTQSNRRESLLPADFANAVEQLKNTKAQQPDRPGGSSACQK